MTSFSTNVEEFFWKLHRKGGYDEIGKVVRGKCLNSKLWEPKHDKLGLQHCSKTDLNYCYKTMGSSRRRLVNGRRRIPLIISCGPAQDDDFDEINSLDDHLSEHDVSASCLSLLESDDYGDIRIGMEHLLILVNGELVDSKLEDSIASALIFGTDDEDGYKSRIRNMFLSFFCPMEDSRQDQDIRNRDTHDGPSRDETSLDSDMTGSTARLKMSLRLPALRVLVSSLELCSRDRNQTINLSDGFWQSILGYMTESLKNGKTQGLATAMIVKCFRLLREIQPQTMEPYLKYSLLPSILHIKENGHSSRDKMIVRECDRLLKCL